MRRMTYLIDSENVNDAWVKLLPKLEKKDRIIIFYTENSPHFTVESAKVITEYKEKDLTWKKCFSGRNALDFQLVSQMGYLISKYPQDGYVIMSNDTGFDAAVKFWMQEGIAVSRIRGNGKAVSGSLAEAVKERRQPEGSRLEKEEAKDKQPVKEHTGDGQQAENKSSLKEWFSRRFFQNSASAAEDIGGETVTEAMEEESQKSSSARRYGQAGRYRGSENYRRNRQSADMARKRLQANGSEKQQQQAQPEKAAPPKNELPTENKQQEIPVKAVIGLCRSIPIRKQERIHEALVALLGGENGREVYRFLKENREFHEKLTTIYLEDRNARMDNYLKVVFDYHKIQPEQIEDIVRLLNKYQTRDLNGLYKAMTGCFGKNKGSQYYSIVKPHVRVIKKL